MIRTFFRHLLDSLKNLQRNGWMTIAAVSSVTITLVLVGIFLSIILNTTNLARQIEKNVQVVAYTNLSIYDQSKNINVNGKMVPNPDYQKVYDALLQVPDVDTSKTYTYKDKSSNTTATLKIQFSDRNQQLYDLEKTYGPTWKDVFGDSNPLYDAYYINATSPSQVKKVNDAVSKLPYFSKVTYGGTNVNQIIAFANTLQTWGLVAAGLLIFIAVFLISNTIRMTIMSRQREIQIMRLVGAKNGYIRWPFFLEGAWVGFLGAVIPSVILAFLYNYVYKVLNPYLKQDHYSLLIPANFVPEVTLLLFVIGVVIGSFGAMLSMRRFLKA